MGFFEINKGNLEQALEIGYSCFDNPPDQQELAKEYASYVDGKKSFYCDITNHQVYLLSCSLWYNENNQPTGIAGLYEYTDMPDDRKIVWLGWFGTSPSQRRQGVATQMIKEIICVAKTIYPNAVVKLFTDSDNHDARSFYEHVGFLEVEESVFNGDDRPKIIYQLDDTIPIPIQNA